MSDLSEELLAPIGLDETPEAPPAPVEAPPAPPEKPAAPPVEEVIKPRDPREFGKDPVEPAPPADVTPDEPAPDPKPDPDAAAKAEEEKAERARQNQGLRDQLTRLNADLASRDAQIKERDEKIANFEKRLSAQEAQLMDTENRFEQSTRQLARKNPLEHSEVTAITGPWDAELRTAAKDLTLSGGQGNQLLARAPDLISAYRNIGEEGSVGFEDRRQAFNQELDEIGGDNRGEIFSLIRRGAHVASQAEEKVADIQSHADAYAYRETAAQYEQAVNLYDQIEAGYFAPSQDLKESDPLNSRVIIAEMIKSSESAQEGAGKTKQFLRKAFLPLSPVDPAELASMLPEQQEQYLKKRSLDQAQAMDTLQRYAGDALMALRLLPGIFKSNQDMRAELEALRRERPTPDPVDPQNPAIQRDPAGPRSFSEFAGDTVQTG